MRILLDQNTPVGVRRILAAHDVRTAFQMGWTTLSNGDLLDAAEQAGFEALVTSDQNMVFQQNVAGRHIAVVVLSTNYWPTIRSYLQRLRLAIANATPGTFSVATFSPRRRSRPATDLKC